MWKRGTLAAVAATTLCYVTLSAVAFAAPETPTDSLPDAGSTVLRWVSQNWKWASPVLLVCVAGLFKAFGCRRSAGDSGQSGTNSALLQNIDNTAIGFLREGTSVGFAKASNIIAGLSYCGEDLVRELAMVISKQGIYSNADYLDLEMRCRVTRFLHLLLKRNHDLHRGNPIPRSSLPSWEEVYGDCSACSSLSRRNAGTRLVDLLSRLAGRIIKDGKDAA